MTGPGPAQARPRLHKVLRHTRTEKNALARCGGDGAEELKLVYSFEAEWVKRIVTERFLTEKCVIPSIILIVSSASSGPHGRQQKRPRRQRTLGEGGQAMDTNRERGQTEPPTPSPAGRPGAQNRWFS